MRSIICIVLIFLLCNYSLSQKSFDSLKIKQPKHYFNTLIIVDHYQKPNKPFKNDNDVISQRLKKYGIKQFNFFICHPIITLNRYNRDSSKISNHHLLLTGNFYSLLPVFEGLTSHNLIKIGAGLRYIYNTGKKGVWFVDIAPFITKDISYESKSSYRFSSTFLYSYNPTAFFNCRLGITKSFMWGNRFYLPFIGFRVGNLDKINLSVQFPRAISFNVPINSRFVFNLFTSIQGGLFNFSNYDLLYPLKSEQTFHFSRNEINTGFKLDIRSLNIFNFYFSIGLSTQNKIAFYSEKGNKEINSGAYYKYFYSENIPPSLFFNFGIVLKLGKTKTFYKNKNLYDVMNINSTIDFDNNNVQIPILPKVINHNLKGMEDLIDYNDL